MRVRRLRLGLLAVLCVLLLGVEHAKAATLTVYDSVGPAGPLVANQDYYAVGTVSSKFEDFIPVFLSGPMGIKASLTRNAPPPGTFLTISFEWVDSTPPVGTDLGTDLVRTFASGGAYTLRVWGTAVGTASYTATLATTPLPPALILFGTALAGLAWLGRRRRFKAALLPA